MNLVCSAPPLSLGPADPLDPWALALLLCSYQAKHHASNGNTSRVPLLISSGASDPRSCSSASSELLFVFLPSRLVVAVCEPEDPLAVIVMSP